MKQKFVFSIIIPVYQVEEYLPQCVDSVVPLAVEDCEILLVLGKSSDKSNEIAEQYARQYERIRVVEQEGTGLSDARNCGVRHSSGEYIIYIDSDDFVDTINLAALLNKIRFSSNQADVYMSDYIQLFPSGKNKIVAQVGNTPIDAGLSALPNALKKKKCFWNVWRYIYRRSFLQKNNISFLVNRTSEDIDYSTKVFVGNPQIEYWNKPYYYYRMQRSNSLMNIVSLKRVQDVTAVIESSLYLLDKTEKFSCSSLFQEQFRFEYLLNIAMINEVAPAERKSAYIAFERWEEILQPAQDLIVTIFYLFMRVFGLSAGAFVLSALKKIKRRITQ